jgi:hypothetical protein
VLNAEILVRARKAAGGYAVQQRREIAWRGHHPGGPELVS